MASRGLTTDDSLAGVDVCLWEWGLATISSGKNGLAHFSSRPQTFNDLV